MYKLYVKYSPVKWSIHFADVHAKLTTGFSSFYFGFELFSFCKPIKLINEKHVQMTSFCINWSVSKLLQSKWWEKENQTARKRNEWMAFFKEIIMLVFNCFAFFSGILFCLENFKGVSWSRNHWYLVLVCSLCTFKQCGKVMWWVGFWILAGGWFQKRLIRLLIRR